jgi:DNA-binding NarL/FixJ family response regulator
MPGMTGLELADTLRKKGYKGRIIFVSAHGHYSIKAIKAEAFDYILKPVDVDELKETIARYRSLSSGAPDPGLVRNFDLSERELELIQHLSKGLSSEQIAEKMFLSRHTIDTHRRNILSKTGSRNTIELLNLLRK